MGKQAIQELLTKIDLAIKAELAIIEIIEITDVLPPVYDVEIIETIEL